MNNSSTYNSVKSDLCRIPTLGFNLVFSSFFSSSCNRPPDSLLNCYHTVFTFSVHWIETQDLLFEQYKFVAHRHGYLHPGPKTRPMILIGCICWIFCASTRSGSIINLKMNWRQPNQMCLLKRQILPKVYGRCQWLLHPLYLPHCHCQSCCQH